jgi:putative cardiolipin synthase
MIGGCALPSLEGREESRALTSSELQSTTLGKAILPSAQQYEGKSGVMLLGEPRESFVVRMLLAQTAQRTLDVQYYIWKKDVSGALMLEAINDAAMRGIRVRLLLDDNGLVDFDDALLALARHDNVQVRIFNPFKQRSFKWLGYLTDFWRVNRRMHNKSFTVDNSVTIIGGRNIGDTYFGGTDGRIKQDLDVLAIGQVVDDVSTDFDRYWASPSAYPIQFIAQSNKQSTYSSSEYLPEQATHPKRNFYLEAMKNSNFIDSLLNQELGLRWTDVTMVSDNPSKILGNSDESEYLINELRQIIGYPDTSLIVVTPYFVPTEAGVEAFKNLAEQGISIQVLTNAMQATDVLPVHAGYAKHRKTLLKSGVQLFELRPIDPKQRIVSDDLGPFGSSASSLHAKIFAIDNNRLFIGSFNFDKRSINLNTELGFVIDSPYLTQKIVQDFNKEAHSTAYEVKLDDEGNLYWIERIGDKVIIHQQEPGMTMIKRAMLSVFNILPIDWLL